MKENTLQLFFGENLYLGVEDFFLRLRYRLIELKIDPDAYGLPEDNKDTTFSHKLKAAAQLVLGISILMLPSPFVANIDIRSVIAGIPEIMTGRRVQSDHDFAVVLTVQTFRLGMMLFEDFGTVEVFVEDRNGSVSQANYDFATVAMTVAVEMMLDKDQSAVAA